MRVSRYNRSRSALGAAVAAGTGAYNVYSALRRSRNTPGGRVAMRVGGTIGRSVRNYLSGPSRYQADSTGKWNVSAMSRSYRNSRRVGTGYYGGKIVKKFRMSRRVKRLAKKFGGVNFNFERTALATDDRCVYVQQCTMPLLNMLKYTCYAIFKRVLNAAGIQISSFSDPRNARIATGDQIWISWKPTIASAVVSTPYTVLAGDITYQNIAEGFWTVIFNTLINNSTGFTPQALFTSSEIVTAAGVVYGQINLFGATVDILTKSSLKMQNRSVIAVADNEAQDVNNVPLHGKGYEGRGNGFIGKSQNLILVPTDLSYGWMWAAAGTNNELAEPPQAYHFQYARGSRKVSIEPGKIRTSILTDKKKMSLNSLFRTLNTLYIAAVDTNQYHNYGKLRMYALERAIAKFGADASPGISVALEHDFKGWITLNIKRGYYTAPENQVV